MWQLDGSGALAAAGAALTFIGAAGAKGNAVWAAGGSALYEITLSGPPGAWVGVCAPSRFAAGWANKGLFYGGPGNLADGGALITPSWGPELADGDVVRMRVEQAGGAATVAFSLNGRALGTAFDIAGWADATELRPCVSLDAPGQRAALAAVPGALPPLAAFARAPPAGAGVEGAWDAPEFSLDVRADGAGAWRLAARVANTLMCRAVADPAGSGRVTLDGAVAATRMMPPPERAAAERAAARLLGALAALRRDGDALVVEGGGAAVRLTRRAGPPAATRDNVRWMSA